jgi:transposase
MAKSRLSIIELAKSLLGLLKELEAAIQYQTLTPHFKSLLLSVIHLATILATERMPKNSTNSSTPPSKDTNRKKKSRAKKRNKGAKKGHKGHNLPQSKNPDETIDIPVDPSELSPDTLWKPDGWVKRQVIEYETKTKVIEYRAQVMTNEKGEKIIAKFPEGVDGPVQYGHTVRALGTYLNVYQLIPFERLSQYFKDSMGLGISPGSLYTFRAEAAKKLEDFEQWAVEKIKNSDVVHVDETGANINGKQRWLHTASTDEAVVVKYHEKRGRAAVDDIGIIPKLKGFLVHDCWACYFIYVNVIHCICCAHLLRELKGVYENFSQKWALEMFNFLIAVKVMVDDAGGRLDEISQGLVKKWYLDILEKGELECPKVEKPPGKRGRAKQTKARNLWERLKGHMDSILRFMTDERVPFTNNTAERDLRMYKLHDKISGCFRSQEGAEAFCRIRSYVLTCARHGIGAFEALETLYEGKLPAFVDLDILNPIEPSNPPDGDHTQKKNGNLNVTLAA